MIDLVPYVNETVLDLFSFDYLLRDAVNDVLVINQLFQKNLMADFGEEHPSDANTVRINPEIYQQYIDEKPTLIGSEGFAKGLVQTKFDKVVVIARRYADDHNIEYNGLTDLVCAVEEHWLDQGYGNSFVDAAIDTIDQEEIKR